MVRSDFSDIFDDLFASTIDDNGKFKVFFKDNWRMNYRYGENKDLIIDIPGYSKEDLNIYVEDSTLVIEIGKDKIARKFSICKGFKVKDAECKNGQLTIYFEEIKKDVLKIDVK